MVSWLTARRCARGREETGAIAVVVAVSLTFLVLSSALVLDFGIARLDRTSNKLTADSAVSGGLQSMYSYDERKPWRAVCTALEYLKVNDPDLSSISGTYTSGTGGAVSNPCTSGSAAQEVSCDSTNLNTWARWDGTATAGGGQIAVKIRSGYALPDPAFPEDTALGSGDNGTASDGGCDQLAVIIRETKSPGLGSLATDDDLVTEVRTVGRATTNTSGLLTPALVLLEQHACNVLTVGGSPSTIEVKGTGEAAGSIHVDSDGNCPGGGYVIKGQFSRHVIARPADTGSPRLPGIITTVAASGAPGAVPANATDGAANTCAETAAGVCGPATGRGIVGRRPADLRYLEGVRTAISNAATVHNSTTTPAGYVTQAGGCTLGDGTNTTASPVFVNCPSGATISGNYTFPNAPAVAFNGPVEIRPSGSLSAPNANRLYVKGRSGSTSSGLEVKGALNLNNASGTTACAGLTTQPRAQLVVGYGPFKAVAGANLHLCHTSVLLADNSGTPSCALPAAIGSAPYPDNGCLGYLEVKGTVDWTAPNLITTRSATLVETNTTAPLEDLAFWSETATDNSLGGGGTVAVTGVFVAPNANPFTMGGGTSATSDTNAQFIARSLVANGAGSLLLRPDPRNSIQLPAPPTIGLVR